MPCLGEDGLDRLFDVQVRSGEVNGVTEWGWWGDMKLFRDLAERSVLAVRGVGPGTYEIAERVCQYNSGDVTLAS